LSLKPIRIVFAGSPDFARVQLDALCAQGYHIVAVFTPPDQPAGRGRVLQPCPVKKAALTNNLPVYQPSSWKGSAPQDLAALEPDLLIVSAYGFLLPASVLKIPRFGCWNVHASLLPQWRGAAPIQHAILAGDAVTGITLMQMSAGMDEGDILLQMTLPIVSDDTTQTLTEKLAHQGCEILLAGLNDISHTLAQAQIQDHQIATSCHKIRKEDGKINWALSATQLERQIRAFNPWPIAFCTWRNETIRIWGASVLPESTTAAPGTLLAITKDGLQVATGEGILQIHRLQIPGKKPVEIHNTSSHWTLGECFS